MLVQKDHLTGAKKCASGYRFNYGYIVLSRVQISLAAWPMVTSVWKNQNTCETKSVRQPSLPTRDKAGIVRDTLEQRRV